MSLDCAECGAEFTDGDRLWSITPMRARRPRDRDGDVRWGAGLETHNRSTEDLVCADCFPGCLEREDTADSEGGPSRGHSTKRLLPREKHNDTDTTDEADS